MQMCCSLTFVLGDVPLFGVEAGSSSDAPSKESTVTAGEGPEPEGPAPALADGLTEEVVLGPDCRRGGG